VPAPLPPPLTWSRGLVAALSDADRAIGRLAGEAARLPNPNLLVYLFVRREAVLSSRIEGTQTSLTELLEHEVGAEVDRDEADLHEVSNYVAAMDLGIERLKKLPLSLRLVKEVHARLMKGVRGGHAHPGEVRRTQVWIGPPGSSIRLATYVPPPPGELADCLKAWEKFLHDRSLPPLVQIALAHYQFEAIHPFHDGNGRVGRLLITLFLIERGILPTPLLYLSAWFEATRRDYYELLLAVSNDGEWEEWLTYFLAGVARQSEDASSRMRRINALIDRWQHDLAAERSRLPAKVVTWLAANPYLMVKGVARQHEVAFTTAERAVQALERCGILKQVNMLKRDRLFCATDLLAILEEPVDLTPRPAD
jgi:Fic family protein